MTLGRGDMVRVRAGRCADGDIVTSAIAYAEVAYGSSNGKPPAIDQLSWSDDRQAQSALQRLARSANAEIAAAAEEALAD